MTPETNVLLIRYNDWFTAGVQQAIFDSEIKFGFFIWDEYHQRRGMKGIRKVGCKNSFSFNEHFEHFLLLSASLTEDYFKTSKLTKDLKPFGINLEE
jgi:hypothetical protein